MDEQEDFLSLEDLYGAQDSFFEGDFPEEEESWSEEESGSLPLIEEEPAEEKLLTPEKVLKKYWGYDSFREKQRDIIDSILEGKDTLGLLPTGGGKSITFQVPGLMMRGVTIVFTPLIALMMDQVAQLKAMHIRAAAIHSGLSRQQIQTILNNAVYGKSCFLYIAPERLASPYFQAALQHMNVSLIVVDECHCISQWGYDFRPAYLSIVSLRKYFPQVPILALTATATPDVVSDVMDKLAFREPLVIQKSFFRSNLGYVIRRTNSKITEIIHILQSLPGSAIVYCRDRERCALIATELKEVGISAVHYHAGLSHAMRADRQERWMEGDIRVMVATNAFGMGINKPDVRCVIHYAMPSSVEDYFQEAGRAGRDGERSYSVVLVGPKETGILRKRITTEFPPKKFISDLYDLMMSYLQIGYGEGLGRRLVFDVEQFIKLFKLPPLATISAIRILDMAGAIRYEEREDQSSRIAFQLERDALYGLHLDKPKEMIIDTLLRYYPGIFSHYVPFEEQRISFETSLPIEEVYQQLKTLSGMNVIRYVPRSALPKVTITTRRQKGSELIIRPEAYQERKERFERRIESVIDYLYRNDTKCRAQWLVEYFGQKDCPECGICDVCVQKRNRKNSKPVSDKSVQTVCRNALLCYLPEPDTSVELSTLIAYLTRQNGENREYWLRVLAAYIEQSDVLMMDGFLIRRRKKGAL